MIDATEDEVMCWLAACALAFGLAFSSTDCERDTIGTDSYHQCQTGEEIDLGIQDEADEPISQGRE